MKIKFYIFYRLLFSFLLTACVIFTEAQLAQPTQTLRPNANINSFCNGYLEFLPKSYDPNNASGFPLLVYLPGNSQAGNGNTEISRLEEVNPPKYIKDMLASANPDSINKISNRFSFIMITPQWKENVFIRYPTVDEINDVITYSIEHYNVDKRRIYLMGISGGGGSVFDYVTEGPEFASHIAAIIPFSGTDSATYAKAQILVNAQLPIWAFANQDDPAVPSHFSTTDWRDSLNVVNGGTYSLFKYNDWPIDGHESWEYNRTIIGDYSESGMNIYQWMLQYSRPAAATNLSPFVNAGRDTSLVAPNDTMALNAIVRDLDTYTLSIVGWSQISGPAGAVFSSPSSKSTTVTGLVPGTYVFRFTAGDGNTATTDDITVTVQPPGSLTKIEGEKYKDQNHTERKIDAGRSNGQFLAWMDMFAWSEYAINTNGGNFSFNFSIQSPYDKRLVILFNNINLGMLDISATGTSWQTFTALINLPAGAGTLRLQPDGYNWQPSDSLSLDFFTFISESVLPAKFVYFNTQCKDASVNLQWRTAQEQNTKDFSVQRSSDGFNWSEIGKLAAAGQSTQERSYLFVDRSSGSSNNMYRIVQSDITGQQTISSIVRSSCSSVKNSISLYPNPSTGNSALNINLEHPGLITLQVLDSKGSLVQEKQIQLPQGNSSVPLNMSSYPKGVYTITLHNGSARTSIKMIKK